MRVSTVQVLRRFTQKLAAAQGMDLKSSLLAALSDPKVIGGLGGAAAGGVGAYGLAKMTQSDEDRESGRTPLLAPLLGALAGGAAGAYGGPQLAEMLKQRKAMASKNDMDAKTVYPQPEIVDAPGPFGGDVSAISPPKPSVVLANSSGGPNAASQAYLDDMAKSSPHAEAFSEGQRLADAR
jgi:hypothetical protein